MTFYLSKLFKGRLNNSDDEVPFSQEENLDGNTINDSDNDISLPQEENNSVYLLPSVEEKWSAFFALPRQEYRQ